MAKSKLIHKIQLVSPPNFDLMQTLESNSAYNPDYSERNHHHYNALAIKSPSQIQTKGGQSGSFVMPG